MFSSTSQALFSEADYIKYSLEVNAPLIWEERFSQFLNGTKSNGLEMSSSSTISVSPVASSNSLENEAPLAEAVTSSENKLEAKFPPRHPVHKYPFPRSSNLTSRQQARYLELYNTLGKGVQPPITAAKRKDVLEFKELQAVVGQEQEEFMDYLFSVARAEKAKYNVPLSDAQQYVKEKAIHNCDRLMHLYSRFFQHVNAITLTPTIKQAVLRLEQALLHVGTVPRLFLPKFDSALPVPIVLRSLKAVNKRYPTKQTNWKQPPSRDANCWKLCAKTNANFCLCFTSLLCLMENQAPFYPRSWQLPIVVDDFEADDGSRKRCVFIDKPLKYDSLKPRDYNEYYHKLAVKAKFLNMTHSTSHKITVSDTCAQDVLEASTSEVVDYSDVETYGSQSSSITQTDSQNIQDKLVAELQAMKDNLKKRASAEQTASDTVQQGIKTCKQESKISVGKEVMETSDHQGSVEAIEDSLNIKLESSKVQLESLKAVQEVASEAVDGTDCADAQQSDIAESCRSDSDEDLVIDLPTSSSSSRKAKRGCIQDIEFLSPARRVTRLSSKQPADQDSDTSDSIEHARGVRRSQRGKTVPSTPSRQSLADVYSQVIDDAKKSTDVVAEPPPLSDTPVSPQAPATPEAPKSPDGQNVPYKSPIKIPTERQHTPNGNPTSEITRTDRSVAAAVPGVNTESMGSTTAADSLLDKILHDQNQLLSKRDEMRERSAKKKATLDTITQPTEDPSQYTVPDGTISNCFYSLLSLDSHRLVVRSSIHGVKTDGAKREKKFARVMSKLEYQSWFGFEQLTHRESCQAWLSQFLHPSALQYRARVNVDTGEIMHLDELTNQCVDHLSGFRPDQATAILASLLNSLSNLENGEYLLSHANGDSHCQLRKATTSVKGGAFNLHQSHTAGPDFTNNSLKPSWIALDPNLLLPYHKQYNRIPATFLPKPFLLKEKQKIPQSQRRSERRKALKKLNKKSLKKAL